MAQELSLLYTKIFHGRHSPVKTNFSYDLFYLHIPLSKIPKLKSCFLSLNKFNLMGFYEKDYGMGKTPENWIKDILNEKKIYDANGEIVLMTLPRVFGYVFNPASFWFCFDDQGGLRAVLSDVSNTFGERHCYLNFKSDSSLIEPQDVLISDKVFHVSPFFDVLGHYEFKFHYSESQIAIVINYYEGDHKVLSTSVKGRSYEYTNWNLLKSFFNYPLQTLKVIVLIHYQALKLYIKGVKYRSKPKPPTREIT